MARRVIHELVDDLDGKTADESITFALDGIQYEIDLSAKNAAKLRESLAPFIQGATRVGRGGGGVTRRDSVRRVTTRRSDRDQNRAIREWALSKGLQVSDRGRIRQDIVDRYNAEAGR